MNNLTDYIKNRRSEGMSDLNIKEELLKSRWKKNEVMDAFRLLDERPEFNSLLPVSVLVQKSFHIYRAGLWKVLLLTLPSITAFLVWFQYGRIISLYINQPLSSYRAILLYSGIYFAIFLVTYVIMICITAMLKIFALPNLLVVTAIKVSAKQAVWVFGSLLIFTLLVYVGWRIVFVPGVIIFFIYFGSIFLALQGYAYEIRALSISRRLLRQNVMTMIWHLGSVATLIILAAYVFSFLIHLASLALFKYWPGILKYEDLIALGLISFFTLPFVLAYLQLLYSNLYYEKIVSRQRSKIEWIVFLVFLICFVLVFVSYQLLKSYGLLN